MTSVGNRVLIIDDDEKLRKLLGEYLKDHGFHTTCRADGADVLGVLSTDSPDLVILDIMLPGRDGLEVLKEIRKDHGLPIIMLTARGDDTDRIVRARTGRGRLSAEAVQSQGASCPNEGGSQKIRKR